jgi:hypothetical protein
MKLFPTVLVFALLAVPALAAETDDATTTGKFT